MLVKINLVVVSMLFCYHSIIAGDIHQDCKNLVLNTYKEINDTTLTKGHLSFTMAIQVRDTNKSKGSLVNSDIFLNGRKMYCSTDEMEVFQDDSVVAVVNKRDKQVFIRAIAVKEFDFIKNIVGVRLVDSILQRLEVQSCRTVNENGVAYSEVVLIPNQQSSKSIPFGKVTFMIDSKTLKPQRIYIEYKASESIKSVLVIYRVFDYSGALPTFMNTSILHNVFHDGKLTTKYKSYHLRDLRKQK